MTAARLAGTVLVTLLASGCQEPAPSGAGPASEGPLGTSPPRLAGEPPAADREPEAEMAAEPSEGREQPADESPPPRTHPQGEEYLSELTVKVNEGEPRATVDQIADSVGATVTTALEEYGIYLLHIDVETAAERDAILERIAAEPGIREARASRSGFRGQGNGPTEPGSGGP